MDHAPLIRQDTIRTHRNGQWWVNCCRNIIDAPGDDGWRPTQAAAEQLAAWHMAGENGPPPTNRPPVPSGAPVQLGLFAA